MSDDKNESKPRLKRTLGDILATPRSGAVNVFSSDDYLSAAKRALDKTSQSSLDDFFLEISSRDKLKQEVVSLESQIRDHAKALAEAKAKGERARAEKDHLASLVAQLEAKLDLGFLLGRVDRIAQERLIQDEDFRRLFAENSDCRAFVMSVDIRRSTELMLKARSPALFAEFLSRLTKELFHCVIENGGVFDKFTGDGILAFFPEDFCGVDYGYRVMKAAHDCHEAFYKVYRESRRSFSAVLNGIGLGIGIDHGTVRLLRAAEGLTVIGVPVVYACRLSGAEPGQTLVNQPAYEVLSDRYGKQLKIFETSLQIKHEGEVLAYRVELGHEQIQAAMPQWAAAVEADSASG